MISMCDDRHRHQEWLRFLKVIDQLNSEAKEIHLIADNYATHKHPKVQRCGSARITVAHLQIFALLKAVSRQFNLLNPA